MTDILAGCNGDAKAATAKLLELRDEEQAHDLAAAMQEAQELSAAPAKVCGRARPCLWWEFCTLRNALLRVHSGAQGSQLSCSSCWLRPL